MDWQHTIDIKTTLRALEGNDNITEVRQRMADTIRAEAKKLPEKIHPNFEDFAVAMELCEDIKEIDCILEDVYDFADANSIWLGI